MQPEPLSSIIRRILFSKGLEMGIKESEVVQRWDEIAGARIAEKAEAYAVRKRDSIPARRGLLMA